MPRAQKVDLSRERKLLAVLALRRRAMTEKTKADYIEALLNFFDKYAWRPLRVRGLVHIYGRLYFDRRRRCTVRQVRKGVFEPLPYVKVARGYRLADLEEGLRHALANQKKGQRK